MHPLRSCYLDIDETFEALRSLQPELPCCVDLAIHHLRPVEPAKRHFILPFFKLNYNKTEIMNQKTYISSLSVKESNTAFLNHLNPSLGKVPGKLPS